MASVFGLTPEQAPVHTAAFLALIHPDDRRLVEESLAQAARDGTDYGIPRDEAMPTLAKLYEEGIWLPALTRNSQLEVWCPSPISRPSKIR